MLFHLAAGFAPRFYTFIVKTRCFDAIITTRAATARYAAPIYAPPFLKMMALADFYHHDVNTFHERRCQHI